ncbi:MAG: PEP-CTERM sorting domain-containing protein [Gemmatimonadota bacterium]
MRRASFLTFAAAVGLVASASAQFSTGALPSGAYITQSGLDWAWANPLPASSGVFYLSPEQSGFGWRLPTLTELGFAPLATDFLFVGGNVPFDATDPGSGAFFAFTNSAYTAAGSAGACATPWFSVLFYHCDWGEGNGQPYGPWSGTPGSSGSAEQLVVRTAAGSGDVVPEPATMTLLATGMFGLAGAARRRRRA